MRTGKTGNKNQKYLKGVKKNCTPPPHPHSNFMKCLPMNTKSSFVRGMVAPNGMFRIFIFDKYNF